MSPSKVKFHPDIASQSSESVWFDEASTNNSSEGLIGIIRSGLLEQLNHWDQSSPTNIPGEKSAVELMVEFVHRKIEQDKELNKVLIAITEHIMKNQTTSDISSNRIQKGSPCSLT